MFTTASLDAKIAKVMKSVKRMKKTGYNTHFKYNFATDADVSDAIRAAMVEHGIAFYASMVDTQQTIVEKEDYGKKKIEYHTICKFEFTFACTETGERRTMTWFGEAADQQDKGVNKAATAAEKYFLLKTFMVSTGDMKDDPDAAVPAPRSMSYNEFTKIAKEEFGLLDKDAIKEALEVVGVFDPDDKSPERFEKYVIAMRDHKAKKEAEKGVA